MKKPFDICFDHLFEAVRAEPSRSLTMRAGGEILIHDSRGPGHHSRVARDGQLFVDHEDVDRAVARLQRLVERNKVGPL